MIERNRLRTGVVRAGFALSSLPGVAIVQARTPAAGRRGAGKMATP
ncbi:hypothetical protein [Sphingomonas sp. PP-CE-1A-559]|nr:hypothetical protein [Sphingomonas sp. PP-CE-1A-559]